MDVATAMHLITSLVLKPGWEFKCHDHQHRFATGIVVEVTYQAHNYNRENAPSYTEELTASASFPLQVGTIADQYDLVRAMLEIVLHIEQHEWREAMRIAGTHEAPFHPHTVEGMHRWGQPDRDLVFGIA